MNLTKRIILSAAALITFIAITYLAFSFVAINVDFRKWKEITRLVCVIFSFGIGGCVFGIVMTLTEKK